jgi:hypothetical protein
MPSHYNGFSRFLKGELRQKASASKGRARLFQELGLLTRGASPQSLVSMRKTTEPANDLRVSLGVLEKFVELSFELRRRGVRELAKFGNRSILVSQALAMLERQVSKNPLYESQVAVSP